MDNKQHESIRQLINKKQFLLEKQNDMILDILSREENQRIINSEKEFRARSYTPLKTLHMFIQQVMSSDKSCNNAVAGINVGRLITEKAPVCPNTGSYTKARKRLSESTIHKLVNSIGNSTINKAPSSWRIHGRDIKAFDGTILTLEDTKANNERYPKHSNKNLAVGYPQMRLLAVFSLITGGVVDYALEATKGKGTGEVTLLRSILECFNERDIAIGDALFCNFFLTHDLMEKKVDVIVPGHIQRHYDFNTGTILGENDHITQWKKPRRPEWMSKEAYKKYPAKIQIREFKVNEIVYITTLLDATTYPKKELHTLYKRRWEVELHLRSIKTFMGMDKLSCKTPDMVQKEIGVHLLSYNIVREFLVDGCIKESALPTHVSFKGTMQLLNQATSRSTSLSNEKKAELYPQLLALIVKKIIGKRPGRVEPRAIRKRNQSFPTLKTNRKIERDKILELRKRWLVENDAA
jgi:IS4 transposase